MTHITFDMNGSPGPVVVEVLPAAKGWLVSSKTRLASTTRQVDRLISSACVIRHDGPQPKMLLLQRHRNDSFPLLWEVPGGCAEISDLSLIHSAVRELCEETGLYARRVLSAVTMGLQLPPDDVASQSKDDEEFDAESGLTVFVDGGQTWGKIVFLIDAVDHHSITVTEHETHRWVSEEELRAAPVETGRDDDTLRMICKSNKRTFLEAFRLAEALGTQEAALGVEVVNQH